MNLKTAASPRKAQNKSISCIGFSSHPLGDRLQLGISLEIFVLFVFFVEKIIFPA